jgi:cytochrome c biogenesis protein CcmG/thiol:disulfide interchange protein DsbE
MKTSHVFFALSLLGSGAALYAQAQDAKPSLPTLPSVPAAGAPAPDFELKMLDGSGKTLQLSSLKGKAVIVSFWATWCEPCKIEMPWLVELQKKYSSAGLQIVGVAMDDADEKDIRAFAHKMGVNYPVLQGTEKVADLYGGLDALPATFWLDRSGKIVDSATGLESESDMEESIKKSLAKADPATAQSK